MGFLHLTCIPIPIADKIIHRFIDSSLAEILSLINLPIGEALPELITTAALAITKDGHVYIAVTLLTPLRFTHEHAWSFSPCSRFWLISLPFPSKNSLWNALPRLQACQPFAVVMGARCRFLSSRLSANCASAPWLADPLYRICIHFPCLTIHKLIL